MAHDAFDDQCTGANPRYPLIEEFRAILLDSYYGWSFVELTRRPGDGSPGRIVKVRLPSLQPGRIVSRKLRT